MRATPAGSCRPAWTASRWARRWPKGCLPPESPAAPSPRKGDAAGGPAEPVPRRLLAWPAPRPSDG
ncbi:hypothetical protein C8244_17820 [Paracidovorax avenae]|nr:hypothetical protein C8244_17820 [Paracidovorax avenae]